tara:strand:- start:796 stop:1074 length:279 start_codon:yes stop_codon:yes gene_type:complete
MGNLADYNINEVAGSAALIISSIGGLLLICFKSRCTNVRLLWGCYDCQRTVADIEEGKKDDESDKTTGTPTTTPTATPTASATVPSLSITNP